MLSSFLNLLAEILSKLMSTQERHNVEPIKSDKAMKRRILMVSAMILLLGSQVQMYAQKKGGPDHKRPGMEMHEDRRPGGPMIGKAICQNDIERLQDFYWKKYRVKLSKI